nr:MAG TPA: hypothetical protein [Caudoviricetes sp.]
MYCSAKLFNFRLVFISFLTNSLTYKNYFSVNAK